MSLYEKYKSANISIDQNTPGGRDLLGSSSTPRGVEIGKHALACTHRGSRFGGGRDRGVEMASGGASSIQINSTK